MHSPYHPATPPPIAWLRLSHFGWIALHSVAAYVLIGCALSAWYMMARIILNELYGRELLPAGKPWIGAPRAPARGTDSLPLAGSSLAGNRVG